MSDLIHRPHNGWTNKFISGYDVYKTVSHSVQESVSSTTEQSINPIEIAPRDFSQHPSHPESYGRLNIHSCCDNQPGHLRGCTKTITLKISCNAFLLLTLVWRDFLSANYTAWGAEQVSLRPKAAWHRGRGVAMDKLWFCSLQTLTHFILFELWKHWKLQCRGQDSTSPIFLTATCYHRRQHAFLSSCAEGWILLVSKCSFYEYFLQL